MLRFFESRAGYTELPQVEEHVTIDMSDDDSDTLEIRLSTTQILQNDNALDKALKEFEKAVAENRYLKMRIGLISSLLPSTAIGLFSALIGKFENDLPLGKAAGLLYNNTLISFMNNMTCGEYLPLSFPCHGQKVWGPCVEIQQELKEILGTYAINCESTFPLNDYCNFTNRYPNIGPDPELYEECHYFANSLCWASNVTLGASQYSCLDAVKSGVFNYCLEVCLAACEYYKPFNAYDEHNWPANASDWWSYERCVEFFCGFIFVLSAVPAGFFIYRKLLACYDVKKTFSEMPKELHDEIINALNESGYDIQINEDDDFEDVLFYLKEELQRIDRSCYAFISAIPSGLSQSFHKELIQYILHSANLWPKNPGDLPDAVTESMQRSAGVFHLSTERELENIESGWRSIQANHEAEQKNIEATNKLINRGNPELTLTRMVVINGLLHGFPYNIAYKILVMAELIDVDIMTYITYNRFQFNRAVGYRSRFFDVDYHTSSEDRSDYESSASSDFESFEDSSSLSEDASSSPIDETSNFSLSP